MISLFELSARLLIALLFSSMMMCGALRVEFSYSYFDFNMVSGVYSAEA